MPRIKRPPPYFMTHLVQRFREAAFRLPISTSCKDWLASNPEVPHGEWYKRFPKFTLAGEGEVPKTFLTPGMVPHGQEIQ
jgi:hypothetical protein